MPSNFSSSDFQKFPSSPGVYLMKNAAGVILYIGKAIHLRRRIKNYFTPGHDGRLMVPFLTRHVTQIETIVVASEKEALILENTLIKKHQPKYNALLKDDKTFLSLMLNHTHPWPMLKVVRCKGRSPAGALHFGPYPNAAAARETLELLRSLFALRQCSDHELKTRTRPCILYNLKRCLAPCCGLCTQQEYATVVQRLISFLKGEDSSLLHALHAQLKEASELLNFEKAGHLYQLIQAIESTLEKQTVHQERIPNLDILALIREESRAVLTKQEYRQGKLTASQDTFFPHIIQDDVELLSSFILQHYETSTHGATQLLLSHSPSALLSELIHLPIHIPRRGLKKQLVMRAQANAEAKLKRLKDDAVETTLLSLEEHLKLTHYPERIECIDQSNLGGTEPVSALVTFIDGKRALHETRTYHLRAHDDYAGLEEVLHRRFQHLEHLPDLLIIDGGRGHLNVAYRVLSALDISSVDIIAIAKEEGRHDRGMTQEALFLLHDPAPLYLSSRSKELFLLQNIRDEAHRTALAFQRKTRHSHRFRSELDSLPGIGPIKMRRLLLHFGSVKQVKAATPEEWKLIKGLSKKDLLTLATWKNQE